MGEFSDKNPNTFGADQFTDKVAYNDKNVSLIVWDTAGQEKFRSLSASFYRDSNACILVDDITDQKSFANIDNWKGEFIRQRGIRNFDSFPFVLIGTKYDLGVS